MHTLHSVNYITSHALNDPTLRYITIQYFILPYMTHTALSLSLSASRCPRLSVHVSIYVQIRMCEHVQLCTVTNTHVEVLVNVRMYACRYVCMYVRTYVCMYD